MKELFWNGFEGNKYTCYLFSNKNHFPISPTSKLFDLFKTGFFKLKAPVSEINASSPQNIVLPTVFTLLNEANNSSVASILPAISELSFRLLLFHYLFFTFLLLDFIRADNLGLPCYLLFVLLLLDLLRADNLGLPHYLLFVSLLLVCLPHYLLFVLLLLVCLPFYFLHQQI